VAVTATAIGPAVNLVAHPAAAGVVQYITTDGAALVVALTKAVVAAAEAVGDFQATAAGQESLL
jgi:hypothetical protein